MRSLLFALCLALPTLAAPDSFAIPQETWAQCRAGNVQAFSEYVGAPAILVSIYKREVLRPEGKVGLYKWYVAHHARVVGSSSEAIPFGKSVTYYTLHEEAPSCEAARGELIYIVSPSAKLEYRSGSIELHENWNRVPLEGGRERYESGKRQVEALKG